MIKTSGFYDLCIEESFFSKGDVEKSIKSLYDYGYRTIAINQTIEDGNLEPKKKKKKGEAREVQEPVPMPYDLLPIKTVIKNLNLVNFQIFNRLTIVFVNQDGLHKVTKSPNFRKYQIVAAAPTTNQALSYTCNNFDADIFTFNPENKFGLRLNRKLYNQLLQRGYHFELLYSPAIEDTTKRKNLIHASHLYHAFGKSRNIIFSSGAHDPVIIRGPYDVINFGFLFGLSQIQCKTAVSYCPHKVVINSVGRRHGKAIMFVENIPREQENTIETAEINVTVDIDDDDDMETDQPKQKKTKV
ncbi:ribonuclease P protein subunit p30 [Diabrotica virgifera virgifera]|uniref:Uncharacterized protein n=1 Tax=Diabrotica virgifera virgifera TaxID=50390 RepID=A0ABM5KXB0_DIAVI|nr:ribonuclease P protein subunit p30 [Diabrotica virgifera virgifera]